jgi:hypothetical protein
LPNKKINIVYLLHNGQRNRAGFPDLLFAILDKCKNKDFHVTFCSWKDKDNPRTSEFTTATYQKMKNKYKDISMSSLVVDCEKNNYLKKLRTVSKYDYEYSLKLDEDIFLPPATFDFIFNNAARLNDKNLVIFPALSSGVPSCDDFMEYNFTPHQIKRVHKEFSNTKIPPHIWGYKGWGEVQRAVKSGYSKDKFYGAVARAKTHFKGMHPIRMSEPAHKLLNNLVAQNIDKFFESRSLFLTKMTAPYLCNSCFLIRTEEWDKVLNSKNLFLDPFDEVPINRYREVNNKNFLYIPNCFGIHTMYGRIAKRVGRDFEFDFFRKIRDEIIRKL